MKPTDTSEKALESVIVRDLLAGCWKPGDSKDYDRSYCVDRVNCFRPAYSVEAIAADAAEALSERDLLTGMVESAAETARRHDLHAERSSFLAILDRVEELWAAA